MLGRFYKLCTALWLGAGASAPGLTINHTHVDTVSSQPQYVMEAIGRQRWFFTHASVGGNIVEGMHTLHAENPSRYQLDIYNWPGEDYSYHGGVGTAGAMGGATYRATAAPATTTGLIYECYRQNPPWNNKLVCFSNSLATSGWGSKVDFAMDKFCWIDQGADANTYLASLSRLEAIYASVRFVYVTMPLSGSSDEDNDLRNNYNRTVRNYCALNNKLLYDLADIQAWTPAGIQQTYVAGGTTNQRLFSGYAVDPSGEDWHLNAAGQQRLALGWYAVAASVASNNPLPLTFRAVALTNSIVLRWSNPTNSGAGTRQVHIRFSTTDYPASTAHGSGFYTGTNLVVEHTALTPGQSYYYSIWISHDGINFTNPP